MKFCGSCGQQIKAEKQICGYCGANQTQEVQESPITIEPKVELKPRKGSTGLVVLLVLLSLATGVLTPQVISRLDRPVATPTPTSSDVFIPENVALKVAAPKVGDCWNSTDFKAVKEEDFYVHGNKISCEKYHDSVTFHIGSLPQNTHLNYDGASTLSGYPSNSGAVSSIQQICSEAFANTFSSATTRLRWLYFIPDPFAWAAGARWVRCDAYATKWGSKVGEEIGAAVLSGYEATLTNFEENAYQICLNVGASGVPYANDSRYADCSDAWDFRLVAEQDISSRGPDYPGANQVSLESQTFCEQSSPGSLAYYPTESGWASGNTFIRCWEQAGAN
jgi:hypothetical protein